MVMKYQEFFVMNHVYVVHPGKRTPDRLCPRDEVAHPSKLASAVTSVLRHWRSIVVNGHEMFYLRIEYDRQFYEDVSSSHMYVAVDPRSGASVFSDAASVSRDSCTDMYNFLKKHHSSQFMATSPVFELKMTNPQAPNIYYSIPVSDTQYPVYIVPGVVVEVHDLINQRCYTVCNGLTLFLAMVRARAWDTRPALEAIRMWRSEMEGCISEAADTSGVWQGLYTDHPIPMIADFPEYYATMYPPAPCSFYRHVAVEDSVPLSQYIDDTDAPSDDSEATNAATDAATAGITCVYATPITSMFPYFNRSTFRYYNRTFGFSDQTPTVFDTPYELEEGDHQLLDIEGMFVSILRSRRAWRWWKRFGHVYLRQAWAAEGKTLGFSVYCYQVLFHLYDTPLYGIRYSRAKVRAIWSMALVLFDTHPADMKVFMNILYVKNIIYENFNINRWHPMPPVAFMKDLLGHYRGSIGWFATQKNKIFTTHTYDRATLMRVFAPYIQVYEEKENVFSLSCSLYQLIKLDTRGSAFARSVLDRNMAQKLLCINRIFAMNTAADTRPLVDIGEHNAYEVGTLLTEYLKSHRGDLI